MITQFKAAFRLNEEQFQTHTELLKRLIPDVESPFVNGVHGRVEITRHTCTDISPWSPTPPAYDGATIVITAPHPMALLAIAKFIEAVCK